MDIKVLKAGFGDSTLVQDRGYNILIDGSNDPAYLLIQAEDINDVEAAGIESFKTVSRSIESHYLSILNFFNNRSTNASAESFNA